MRWMALVGLAGCASNTDVLASQFDQSCKLASDCVWVSELSVRGSACTYHCPTQTSAINKSAQAAFDAAVQSAGGRCTSVAQPGCVAIDAPDCVSGRCGGGAGSSDGSGDSAGTD